MKITRVLLLCMLIHLFSGMWVSNAQQTIRLLPDQSEITIRGTSNLHDWEEKVENYKVNLNLEFDENKLKGISQVHVTLMSGSIVSENSIMTNKTHDALNVNKYPQIEFRLVSVDNLTATDGKFSGTLAGDITLAGVTKRINVVFTGVHAGNNISIKGSKELNMVDFRIEPPTAMLGTLKTGKEVTVSFQLSFQIA